jgi:hypothetical protein
LAPASSENGPFVTQTGLSFAIERQSGLGETNGVTRDLAYPIGPAHYEN